MKGKAVSVYALNGGRGFRKPRRLTVWSTVAGLMVLPVLAVRDIDDLTSSPGDFMFLLILLAGVALAYELGVRVTGRSAYPVALGIALAASFGSIWINLAVGIIGSEDNPANLIYAGVIAVATAGALLGRFQPLNMARTMVAAAIAQMLAFVLALVAGFGFTGPITVFFTALWLISSWLFGKAAGERTSDCALP